MTGSAKEPLDQQGIVLTNNNTSRMGPLGAVMLQDDVANRLSHASSPSNNHRSQSAREDAIACSADDGC